MATCLEVGLANMVMTEQMGTQDVSLKVGLCSINVRALQMAQLVLERQAGKGPRLMKFVDCSSESEKNHVLDLVLRSNCKGGVAWEA